MNLPKHSSLLASLLGAALLLPATASAVVIYEDDFSGTAGTLINGRSPNVTNATGNTYTATSTLELSGTGRAEASAPSGGANGNASIALPSLSTNDVITITASFKPQNNADANNWIGFGLSDSTGGLAAGGNGTAWALLRGGFTHGTQGQVTIFSGGGTAGQLYKSSSQESQWGATNPSTMTWTYTVSSGNLTVTLGTDTLYDDIIDYGGAANTPAPIGAIDHFTFQFQNQARASLDQSFIESYSVDISPIPEPSSAALMVGSLAGLLLLRRRARR